MTEGILVALIAVVPSTVAAGAAWRNALQTRKKVSTSNGHSIGQLAEANYELSKSTAHRLDEVSKSLEVHINDDRVHCYEQTRLLNEHLSGHVARLNEPREGR